MTTMLRWGGLNGCLESIHISLKKILEVDGI